MLKIFMGDMLYANDGVGNRMCPMPVGFVAAYVRDRLSAAVDVRMFKRPNDLISAVASDKPDVVALSNYSWTHHLSSALLSSFKKENPSLVTVMGGPNYPRETARQEDFFRRNDGVDFQVYMEGEQAFLSLAERLLDVAGDVEKAKIDPIAGVHFINRQTDTLVTGLSFDRLIELDTIPSPYLTGLMDPFLEMGLQPMIQTNRGCPFTCTFCVEGQAYHTKVRRFSLERVTAELEYIAERVTPEWSLSITDSNFGMYEQDIETCKVLRRLQDEYGWPFDIVVSSGKNRVDRVTECARLTRGALSISLQVQSMDEEVLKNIRRQNISVEGLKQAVENTQELSKTTRAFSAVIAPLPGETLQSHIAGLKELVDMDMDYVCPFQLILLDDTEMAGTASREKFQMVSKWRPVPNYYGEFGGVKSLEVEEICVANSTFTYQDYLEARGLHFMLQCYHSDDAMLEIRRYLTLFGISPFDWIRAAQLEMPSAPPAVRKVYDDFIKATGDELWDTREEALGFFCNGDNIDLFVNGDMGDNVLFKFRAICMTSAFKDFMDYGVDIATKMALEGVPETETLRIREEIAEVARYVYSKRRLPLDQKEIENPVEEQFQHDMTAWESDGHTRQLSDYRRNEPVPVTFSYEDMQKNKLIHAYRQLGTSMQGIGQVVRKHNPLYFVRETARAGYYGIDVPVRVETT
jgi:hypothetical protein